MPNNLTNLAKNIGKCLKQLNLKLSTAESCTGGMLASTITSISGSSAWFERGLITYSNQAKQELLQVNSSTIDKFGAVSAQTALEMAQGAINNSNTQISIATTGIAGPSGGTKEKPVGTVWIAWCNSSGIKNAKLYNFSGTREQIRINTVKAALDELLILIQKL